MCVSKEAMFGGNVSCVILYEGHTHLLGDYTGGYGCDYGNTTTRMRKKPRIWGKLGQIIPVFTVKARSYESKKKPQSYLPNDNHVSAPVYLIDHSFLSAPTPSPSDFTQKTPPAAAAAAC